MPRPWRHARSCRSRSREAAFTAPYGDVCASGHAAYLYEMRHGADIDTYASLFVANDEAESLLIVPVAGLRADSVPHRIHATRHHRLA